MDLLRTLLFVPGNRERMLERAAAAGADAIVIDLEDAVPAAREAGRARARARLACRGSPTPARPSSCASTPSIAG